MNRLPISFYCAFRELTDSLTRLVASLRVVYRLQEETKKAKQLADDLGTQQRQLREKTTLSDELQRSLVALKEELATSLLRSEQTKRQLEDQLADEERAREELHEHNLTLRKTNKRLATELEALAAQGPTVRVPVDTDNSGTPSLKAGGVTPAEMKGLMRKKLDALQQQLEWSQMRENDLWLTLARREDTTRTTAAPTKPAPVRRKLSRMPSTTVITRFLPNPDNDVAKAGAGATSTTITTGGGSGPRSGDRSTLADTNDGLDDQVDDGFDDSSDTGVLEIDEKNFEAYHQEVHRMLTEIEEGRSRSQKQQKTIGVRGVQSVWRTARYVRNHLRSMVCVRAECRLGHGAQARDAGRSPGRSQVDDRGADRKVRRRRYWLGWMNIHGRLTT